MDHIAQRLARARLGVETGEIGRMALMQRHAHLRVVLETADAGAMTSPWVDHQYRAHARSFASVGVRGAAAGDAQQRVVGRLVEVARIERSEEHTSDIQS